MKIGTRVMVKWQDIASICHSDEQLDPMEAETCGWVIRETKKELEIATSRYAKCDYKDRIVILKGVIDKIEVI